MIHNAHALIITAKHGNSLIFHQGLIHGGSRSRTGLNDTTLEDLRLLCYLWTRKWISHSLSEIKSKARFHQTLQPD